jgi:hypothetical protein
MAIEDLKPYQFTKDKQPPNESKRKPKLKTLIKRTLKENYKVFEGKIKDGNSNFWKMGIDEVSEKVNKHKVDGSIQTGLDITKLSKEDMKRIKDNLDLLLKE